MKIKSMSILAISALLAGCCCDTPQEMPAEVVCQPTITPGSCNDFVKNVGDRVFFEFDKSLISDASRATLQKQAEWLNQYPGYKVTILGHCDERGTSDYNLALGERRAQAAYEILVSCGVAPSRITKCSKGKEDPVVAGSNEEAWAQNRVAISLLMKDVAVAPACAAVPVASPDQPPL